MSTARDAAASIYLLSGREDVLRHFTDEAAANAALAEEQKRDRGAFLMTVEEAKIALEADHAS